MPNDGTIDLGSKPSTIEKSAPSEPKVYYPSINIRDASGLDELPDGEFKFTGVGKVVSYTESTRDGKDSCTCEIEIHSIKPDAPVKKSSKSKDSGDLLDESLDKIAGDKANDMEDAADEYDE